MIPPEEQEEEEDHPRDTRWDNYPTAILEELDEQQEPQNYDEWEGQQ